MSEEIWGQQPPNAQRVTTGDQGDVLAALKAAQSVLHDLTRGDPKLSTMHLWARAVEAEHAARKAVRSLESNPSTCRHTDVRLFSEGPCAPTRIRCLQCGQMDITVSSKAP